MSVTNEANLDQANTGEPVLQPGVYTDQYNNYVIVIDGRLDGHGGVLSAITKVKGGEYIQVWWHPPQYLTPATDWPSWWPFEMTEITAEVAA